jgi:predicted HAD superfamily Cof-like phosphohydrolase
MRRRALASFLLAAATDAMQVVPRKATVPLAEPSCLQDVAAFHSLFGAPVVDEPALPDAKRCTLRVNLLQEELDELKAALEAGDVVEAADALADLQYVLAGAVHELGMGSRFKAVCHTEPGPRTSRRSHATTAHMP